MTSTTTLATRRQALSQQSSRVEPLLSKASRSLLASTLSGQDKARVTRVTGLTYRSNPSAWYKALLAESVRCNKLSGADAARVASQLGWSETGLANGVARMRELNS